MVKRDHKNKPKVIITPNTLKIFFSFLNKPFKTIKKIAKIEEDNKENKIDYTIVKFYINSPETANK